MTCKGAQINVGARVHAVVLFVRGPERIDWLAADSIIEAERHVTTGGRVGAVDGRLKMIASLHAERRVGAMKARIEDIGKDSEQASAGVDRAILQLRLTNLPDKTAHIAVVSGTGQLILDVVPSGGAIVRGKVIRDTSWTRNARDIDLDPPRLVRG